MRLTITDMLGRKIADEQVSVRDGSFTWHADHMSFGQQMLLYRIQQEDRVYSGRIIRTAH